MHDSYDEHVAIFWDYENCAPPCSIPGYDVVNNIRQVAHEYGSVKLFKAYLELSEMSSSKAIGLRSELQSCGVSLTDCPHNGRKEVADKMIIVDMLTYAIDNPAPATIVLISGDRDFVYAVSVLRLRRYRIVLVAPNCAHASLKSQASSVLDWDADIMRKTGPRPQTVDGLYAVASDDGVQRSPRRSGLPFGASLLQPTPKAARQQLFRGPGAAPPVIPMNAGNVTGAGNDFQGGRHLRNPSVATTDETYTSLETPTTSRDTPAHRRGFSAGVGDGLGLGSEGYVVRPAIQDIAEIIHDLESSSGSSPWAKVDRERYMAVRRLSDVLRAHSTYQPWTDSSGVQAPTTVPSPAKLTPVTAADPNPAFQTNQPPIRPIQLNNFATLQTLPPVAPMPDPDPGPAVAPAPAQFPLPNRPPVPRPASVEPLFRAPSDGPMCSISSSSPSPALAPSRGRPDASPQHAPSDAMQPAPTAALADADPDPGPARSTTALVPATLAAAPAKATAPPAALSSPLEPAPAHDASVTAKVEADPLAAVPAHFHRLMFILEHSRLAGTPQLFRSLVGQGIQRSFYASAGVAGFEQYSLAAEKAGLVVLGGEEAKAWISLHPTWHGKVPVLAKSS